ncbi:MAG: serine/threonine protein kinase [Elusimicrobium sp.]|jgi:tRNA A-37 threonylcarbamoyl transferase component Bud32|nr:serine/threonine protein kinase [Elusimicrobium sp.]
MFLKRLSLIPFFLFPLLTFAQVRAAAPLQVGGSFSQSEATQSSAAAQPAQSNMEDELTALGDMIRMRQFDAVVQRVNALVAQGRDTPRFNLYLAQAYEGLGKWDDCIYRASEVIAVAPTDSRGYTLRASCYYRRGEYEKAGIDIDKSLNINANSGRSITLKKMIEEAMTPAVVRPAAAVLPPQNIRPAAVKITAPEDLNKKLANIRWWLIYFIIIMAVVSVYIYFRYTPSSSRKTSAKKVDIKEQYNFIRQIGEGGMGKVYEAYDKVLKRRVAIKRVKPELVRSDYVREQFLSEARTVALLRHPNIVEIYTVIESDNSLYLVFEYVDGQTLETRLDIDGFVPFSEAKNIFESVCRGLHYAHAQDIIHCDLKPGNIMITDTGVAKVMDFGVAKKVVEGDNGARTVAGTPAYMAPEQQKGFMKKQSDIYSLGVCLYESLVGQVPWSVAGFDIANKRIVPPSKLVPFVPIEVDELLTYALKEDPNQRIQSIDEFWGILSRIEPLKEAPRPKHI